MSVRRRKRRDKIYKIFAAGWLDLYLAYFRP